MQRHLLSLRKESEPVKKSKNPKKKKQTKTDTFQKPLESLSGNYYEKLNFIHSNIQIKADSFKVAISST